MRSAALLLLPLLVACAASRVPRDADPGRGGSVEVHARFGALRPVMVQLRVDGRGGGVEELRSGLYRGLIAKGYSVLAPGAAGGSEVGIFRARISDEGAGRSVDAVMEDPFGTILYRYAATSIPGEPLPDAGSILTQLPAK